MAEIDQGGSGVVEIDLKDVFSSILKHRHVIISSVVCFIAIAVIYSVTAVPVYRSTSRILVDAKPPKIVKVDSTILPDYTDHANFFNSQIEILKSHAIAELVFNDLGSYEPWGRRHKPAEKLNPILSTERIDAMLKHVKVTPVRMTDVIEIDVQDEDPQLAARIANTWVRAYFLFSSVDQLLQRRSELETDLNQQLKFLKDKHPVIVSLRNEIDLVDQKITRERERLKNASADGAVSGNGDIMNVKVLDRGQIPLKPVSPRKVLNGLIALILGLFVGVGLAMLFESLDQTVKTGADVERVLRTVCLAAIPRQMKDKAQPELEPEFIAAKGRHSTVAEAFRGLRTGIIFSNPDLAKKTILVTSSAPSEGKTTVAMNLATVFAQADEKTIIVDTDLRSPRLHGVFKIPRGQGITNILAFNEADVLGRIHKTDIPNLDFLSCGELVPNPSELLGSRKMGEFITKLSSMYDRIIFDTPPIMAATDAVVLSTRVDATILVVTSGQTQIQAAVRSLFALKAVRAHVFGVVLNKVNPGDKNHYYYLYGENSVKKV